MRAKESLTSGCLLLPAHDEPGLPDGSGALLLVRWMAVLELCKIFETLHFHPHTADDKS